MGQEVINIKRYLFSLIFGWLLLLCACHPLDNPSGNAGDEPEPEPLRITDLRFEVDTLFMSIGEVRKMKGIITPEELSPEVHIHWKGYNDSVIKVDEEGNVTAIDYGYTLLEAEIHNDNYGFFNRNIPVYVSRSVEPIPNPEEMYQKWLGSWQLSGPVYHPVYSSNLPTYSPLLDYFAAYTISISELVPMESYKLVGWEQFLGPSTGPSPFPGAPLVLVARFDKTTGDLVFFRNHAANLEEFYQTPYWSTGMFAYDGYYELSPNHNLGSFDHWYPCPEDVEIAYARFMDDKQAIVRGAYHLLGGTCYYHRGMGFSTCDGETLDKPMYFPLTLTRLNDIHVQQISLSETTLEMIVGTEYDLSAQWSPSGAIDLKYKWTSSHPEVVSVSYPEPAMLVESHLQALAPGRSDVTLTMGEVSATCEVVVKIPYIRFFKNSFRDLVCERWDTDGDGELSYEEAAAVTSLGSFRGVFIEFLDELQYFTSVKEIEPYCFESTSLHNVIIPASVEKIDTAAFALNYLNNVVFLGEPPALEYGALGYPDTDNHDWVHYWVPDEYYDLYMEEARKEGSMWVPYRRYIYKVSERKNWDYTYY